MKTGVNLLSEGIQALRQKDEDIDKCIGPRSEEFIRLLWRYIEEIELFNHVYNMVGTNETGELITRHILDSLAPLGIISRLIDGGGIPQIADIGSGAGLPGIPLALALPKCEFTLIERMGRRAGFLWNAKAVLSLSNVTVEEGELEKTEGTFQLVTFRAFKPLEPKLLKSLFRVCEDGGLIAAYKGRCEKIEQEMSPLEKLPVAAYTWKAIPYNVPFLDDERHLLVIRPRTFQKTSHKGTKSQR
jgi:16S rRNA (guanine527-N7)-methyltransferase